MNFLIFILSSVFASSNDEKKDKYPTLSKVFENFRFNFPNDLTRTSIDEGSANFRCESPKKQTEDNSQSGNNNTKN